MNNIVGSHLQAVRFSQNFTNLDSKNEKKHSLLAVVERCNHRR